MDIIELEGAVNGYPLLHSVLLGSAVWLLGTLENVWIVSHALLPACLWLLAYRMLRETLPDRLIRGAVAWGLLLFAFEPRNALLIGKWALMSQPFISRLPQPALSFLLALGVLALCSATLAASNRRWVLLACLTGAGAGLLFYAYYYYWVACFLGLAALFLICAVVNRPVLIRLGIVLVVGCVVGLPYVVRLSIAQKYATQQDLLERVGQFHRTPIWTGLLLALATGALLTAMMRLARRHEADARRRQTLVLCGLCLAFLFGGAAGLNLHLITGYDAQHYFHFRNRVIQPFGFLAGILLFSAWVNRAEKSISSPAGQGLDSPCGTESKRPLRVTAQILACATIGYLLLSSGYRQVSTARQTVLDHRRNTPRYQTLLWVRQHVPPERVVGTLDLELLTMIPGVAGTWNFVPSGHRSMATNEEILTRYVIAAWLEGETAQTLGERLANWPEPHWRAPMYVHFVSSSVDVPLHEANTIFQNLDPLHPTSGRHLDYYILPGTCSPTRLRAAFPRAQVLYQNEDWAVYELAPNGYPDP